MASATERLLAAYRSDDAAGVRRVLEEPGHGELVNLRLPDDEGRGHWEDPTLLIEAARRGNEVMVRLLLERGADAGLRTVPYYDDWGNERGGGESAWDVAAAYPQIRALLERGGERRA